MLSVSISSTFILCLKTDMIHMFSLICNWQKYLSRWWYHAHQSECVCIFLTCLEVIVSHIYLLRYIFNSFFPTVVVKKTLKRVNLLNDANPTLLSKRLKLKKSLLLLIKKNIGILFGHFFYWNWVWERHIGFKRIKNMFLLNKKDSSEFTPQWKMPEVVWQAKTIDWR